MIHQDEDAVLRAHRVRSAVARAYRELWEGSSTWVDITSTLEREVVLVLNEAERAREEAEEEAEGLRSQLRTARGELLAPQASRHTDHRRDRDEG